MPILLFFAAATVLALLLSGAFLFLGPNVMDWVNTLGVLALVVAALVVGALALRKTQ